MGSQLPNIPQAIVLEEILPRLPVKSLLRFQSVSKSWSSSISDPKFSLKTKNRRIAVLTEEIHDFPDHEEAITEEYDPLSSHALYDIDSNSCSKDVQNPPFLEKNHSTFDIVRLFCSYNGLLLFSYCEDFVLFNPRTRKCKWVLSYPFHFSYVTCAGICYDSSAHDYKVVVGISRSPCLGGPWMEFSSFRSRLWKKVKFPRAARFYGCGPVIDEKMHWLAYEGEEIDNFSGPDLIFFFDPVKDEFVEVPTPDPKYGIKNDIVGLFDLEESLAVARWEKDGGSFGNGVMELLAMKEYGIKDSWTVMFTFSNLDGWHPRSLEILGFSTFMNRKAGNCGNKFRVLINGPEASY